jgi:hypothetical protein
MGTARSSFCFRYGLEVFFWPLGLPLCSDTYAYLVSLFHGLTTLLTGSLLAYLYGSPLEYK